MELKAADSTEVVPDASKAKAAKVVPAGAGVCINKKPKELKAPPSTYEVPDGIKKELKAPGVLKKSRWFEGRRKGRRARSSIGLPKMPKEP